MEQTCILIVDDAPENVDVLRSILGDEYKLKVALNGEKALELASKAPKPDLVLLDVIMPGMDGYEVCERLKRSDETKDISVIFQTSKKAPVDEQRAFELGASDYITKPFDPDVVKSRVKTRVAVLEEKKRLRMQIESLHNKIALPKTENEIVQLIAKGESNEVEFKSSLRHNIFTKKNESRIENASLKSVAGFLNGKGGYLLVGIDDDGNTLGLEVDRFKNDDKLLLHWFNLLKETMGADLITNIESELVWLEGKQVLIAACNPSSRPVFFNRESEEHFYLRVGNATQSLKPSEMLAYVDNHFGSAR